MVQLAWIGRLTRHDLLAVLGVEGDQERLLALVLVGLDEDAAPRQHGRGADAHADGLDVADVARPELVAREIVDVESGRSEVGEDALAVGRDGGRRERAHLVPVVVHGPVVGDLRPGDGAIRAVDRDHLERVPAIGAQRVGMLELLTFHHVRRRLDAGKDLALDGGGEEDAVAPHHGRRMAAALDLGLPLDVAAGRGVPLEWDVGGSGDAGAARAAPLRPGATVGLGGENRRAR